VSNLKQEGNRKVISRKGNGGSSLGFVRGFLGGKKKKIEKCHRGQRAKTHAPAEGPSEQKRVLGKKRGRGTFSSKRTIHTIEGEKWGETMIQNR